MIENQPCGMALKWQGPSSDSQSDSVSQARPGKLFTTHRPTRSEHILSILYFTRNVKRERWKVEGGSYSFRCTYISVSISDPRFLRLSRP